MTSSFWLILLATILYGALHSILAASTTKALAARQVGEGAYHRFYRLFFSILAVVLFVPVLLLTGLLPDRAIYSIPPPWVYLTLALQALSVLGILATMLMTGALRFVGVQQLFQSDQERPERLIVSGLYRWVRHPLYTFLLLLLWLMPVMTWNILALNLGLSAYMLAGSVFEEHKLAAQFGQAYLDYRARTPRLIPGLRLRK